MRSWVAAVSVAALLTGQAGAGYAQSGGGGGNANPIVAYCGTERAPLVDLNNQYDEIQRSRVAQSVKNGAIAAGAVLAGGLLGGMLGGGNKTAPSGGGFNAGSAIFGSNRGGSGDARQTAALAVVAALSVSVVTYVSLKGETDDRKALARAIEQDAQGQIPLGRTIAGQAKTLADCRARQVDDFKMRLAAATGPADRNRMKREGDQIQAAIKADIAVTDKVVGHQADLAKTYTQARAMADNKSEADELGAQKPAYADTAGTQTLDLPKKGATTAAAPSAPKQPAAPSPPPPPPPPADVVLVVQKPTPVRETAATKGKLILTLPVNREVKAVGQSADNGWWQIDVAGAPGYLRETTVTVKGSDRGATTTTAAAKPEQTDNVREYNKVVLEARDEGPNRMKTLLTSFQ